MKKYLSVLVLMAFPVLAIIMMLALRVAPVRASGQPTATEIMEGIDRVRNPDRPYRVVLVLTEYVNSNARDRDDLILYVKQDEQSHQFNNLVRYADHRATLARWSCSEAATCGSTSRIRKPASVSHRNSG